MSARATPVGLSAAAHAYIWSVGLAALALLGVWTRAWRGTVLFEPSLLPLMVLFLVLAAVAVHFPLHVGPKYNVNTQTAVQFAALLLFGPPAAMAIVGTGAFAGLTALKIRLRLTRSRHFRSWRNIAFNTGQLMLATGLAGAVYFNCLPHAVPAPKGSVANVWAVPASAAVMWLTSSGLVAVIAGLQTREHPFTIWRSVRHRELLHEGGLFLLGLVTARTAQNDPWVPLVMVLPTWIIYLATKRNVQLIEQTIAAVETLADVVDRRDSYTFEHSKRVAHWAQRLARELRLPAEQVAQIHLAARVHDLGKIGVPDSVLRKPGALAPDEWETMRAHAEMGYEILAGFPEYRTGRDLVRSHHERHDGRGYPRGLAGRQLPFGAEIIAVADTLDAMTSDRPYRPALPLSAALAELRRGVGTQFNPTVVAALERLVGDTLPDGPAPRPTSPPTAAQPAIGPRAAAVPVPVTARQP
jgi:hypothetical protein